MQKLKSGTILHILQCVNSGILRRIKSPFKSHEYHLNDFSYTAYDLSFSFRIDTRKAVGTTLLFFLGNVHFYRILQHLEIEKYQGWS